MTGTYQDYLKYKYQAEQKRQEIELAHLQIAKIYGPYWLLKQQETEISIEEKLALFYSEKEK